jgi:Domain of unknown function (DU1801)
MAQQKTTETTANVMDFVNAVPDPTKRNDSLTLIDTMQTLTGFPPKMWGPSIIGFGSYHYRYESGREGNSLLVGFSPRKAAITLYVSGGKKREELLAQLGKHKTEKGCIYVKKLADIDLSILEQMIVEHVQHLQELYPQQK